MNKLPIGFGYVIAKEPKAIRRTFALQESVIGALKAIASEKNTNLNALVSNILSDYVRDYFKEATDEK